MPKLQELLSNAENSKEKLSAAKAAARDRLSYLNEYFRISFIYSSNAMDGLALTREETAALLKKGVPMDGLPSAECWETLGYETAYHNVLALSQKPDLSVTDDLLRDLHRLLCQRTTPEQAGQYRTFSSEQDHTGYLAPAPEDLPHLMSHLGDQIYFSKNTLHPIELAAMAHKRLMDIQPFSQGNGRIARLLMNLLLLNYGYDIALIPPERQQDYCNAMAESRRFNDIEPFSRMVAECVIDTGEKCCMLMQI